MELGAAPTLHSVWVVAQRATLAQVVAHAVALDVGLVIDIESVFCGQFVEAVALWVMAEAPTRPTNG